MNIWDIVSLFDHHNHRMRIYCPVDKHKLKHKLSRHKSIVDCVWTDRIEPYLLQSMRKSVHWVNLEPKC